MGEFGRGRDKDFMRAAMKKGKGEEDGDCV